MSKIYDEGEQELSEDLEGARFDALTDAQDDEKVFLIDQAMKFQLKREGESVILQWADPVRRG